MGLATRRDEPRGLSSCWRHFWNTLNHEKPLAGRSHSKPTGTTEWTSPRMERSESNSRSRVLSATGRSCRPSVVLTTNGRIAPGTHPFGPHELGHGVLAARRAP